MVFLIILIVPLMVTVSFPNGGFPRIFRIVAFLVQLAKVNALGNSFCSPLTTSMGNEEVERGRAVVL